MMNDLRELKGHESVVLRFSSMASLLEDIYDSSCLRLAPSFTAGVCSGRARGVNVRLVSGGRC